MVTGTQLKSAIKAFMEEHARLDDALEDKQDVRAAVRAKEVFRQLATLEAQIASAGDVKTDPDLELAQALLLGFRAALLRSIAVGHFKSGNHVWEREARNEHGPRAVAAYEKILAFSNGKYAIADTLYQLGWLYQASGNREAALKYFRELTTRFPADPVFGERAALRIVEIEGEQEKDRSGLVMEARAGHPIPCARIETLREWHLPLQCAACSIQWLLGQMGRDVPRQHIDAALGGRFLPRSARIPSALASLGLNVSRGAPVVIEDGVDRGAILVQRRTAVSIDHVIALYHSGGIWSLFDPGNLVSHLYLGVSRDSVHDLTRTARLIFGVR